MKISLLGGLRVEHAGRELHVSGTMQVAVLFRLAVDAGSAVSYRSIAEDIWAMDAPENTRAALQSIVSRLRAQLPPDVIESTPGGYRLAVGRADVDALAFQDLVAAASAAPPGDAAAIASEALGLWRGEPWVPSDNFDWFERDMLADRDAALKLGGVAVAQRVVSSIPAPLTNLIGRERELEAIADQLASHRLVTIIGTGGAGKTRLAVETARSHAGSVLVELAPVEPFEVWSAVLGATGREIRTGDSSGDPIDTRGRVLEALGGRDVLLVLDNCEHVVDSVADLVFDLLGLVPHLTVLVTSREPLNVPGESFVTVGSLPRAEAVELFSQRAAAATGAELTADQREIAGTICDRLDGLPLAIELAAARLRTMSAAEVLAGLDDRFSLLTGGFRTALPRHQTLRAMIDWSWSLLSSDERTALSHFAVYPAGSDASEAALLARSMGLTSPAVFDALVDRSLLQRNNGRYRELETIREYGIERLAEQEALANARASQVRHMARTAARRDAMLRGPDIHDALTWFDAEEDNLAAALRFAISAGMAREAIDLTIACFWYWTIRDREADSRAWLSAVGPLAAGVDSDAARVIHLVYPVVAAFSGNTDGGERADDEEQVALALAALPAITVSAAAPDIVQLIVPVIGAFSAAMDGGEGWMTRVRLPRGEDLGLTAWPTAVLNVVRAATAQNRGDVPALGEASELAVAQFSHLGDWWGLALAQQMRAEWLSVNGMLDDALRLSDESTENMRRITSSWDLAQQRSLSVSLLTRMGRSDEARERVEALVAEAEAGANVRTIAQVHATALSAYVSLGQPDRARAHLERFEEVLPAMARMPEQILAWVEAGRAGIFLLEGDPDAAEVALRAAITYALASHDQPVMGSVALDIGMLAMARGDVAEALRALDLSSAVIGAEDPTDPRVIAILAAGARAATERTGGLPTRPVAVEALRELLP